MVKKRVTRKQLLKEPDEFLTWSARTLQFVATYRQHVLYGAVGVVGVVLIFILFQFMSARSEKNAFALFREGYSRYAMITSDPSGQTDDMAAEKFAELVEKYGSSTAAKMALPLYADLSYRTGDYDKAIRLYQRALQTFSGDVAFERIAWNGLAYAYEGKEDYATAVKWFEKLTGAEGDFLKADAYYNLGRMYEALNDREKAVEAYRKVATDFSQSVHAKLAGDKAARL
jgi:tetratricopeptide (TPR) repeat protein